MLTEGTYPYVVGGVSSWCQDLITGLDDMRWHIVPITAGGIERASLFEMPANAEVVEGIELWGPMPRRMRRSLRQRDPGEGVAIPAELVRLVLGTEPDPEGLTALFGWCRAHPRLLARVFRSRYAWRMFLRALHEATTETGDHLFAPVPMTALDAARLWQTMFWLAATATVELPESDVILCTAAGWPAVMASLAKAERGTPVVVAEHGVYVREAYLDSVRRNPPPGHQFGATRLAAGLARHAYAIADRITPVCDGHHAWEELLGADPDRIQTIVNGVEIPTEPAPPAGDKVVVSVGRIDPLKDIATALRTARIVCDLDPDVRFLHYGPVTPVNQSYHDMCLRLHRELDLGDRFRFMGGTSDPRGAMRSADVYLSTSISEGLPLSVLEAMTEARPVVATDVGGCADLVHGCGVLAAAGDAHGLAGAVKTLVDDPDMARILGRRGYRRVERRFSRTTQLRDYRRVLTDGPVARSAPAGEWAA